MTFLFLLGLLVLIRVLALDCRPGGQTQDETAGSAATGAQMENPIKATKAQADEAGVSWVVVPGGSFGMGRDGGGEDECPEHRVTLTGFEISKTEVTVAQYRVCVHAGVCTEPDIGQTCNWGKPEREDHPVNCVDWNQALAYALWLGGRLPTEAQWEYAAMGGKEEVQFPWGDGDVCGQANFCDRNCRYDWRDESCNDGYPVTAPVMSYAANGYGLFDMAGNVFEWTMDWYDEKYYQVSPESDPPGPAGGSRKVIRGGCWDYASPNCQVKDRWFEWPDDRNDSFGIRLVRPLRQP